MNKKIKTLIVEDEKPARDLLKAFLKSMDDIEVIGEAADGFDGAMAVKNLHPELLFLDVQMPRLNGFEMLEVLDEMPLVIFTTAFDEFAIKAFEVGATDYLMKPFSEQRLKEAVTKAVQRLKSPGPNDGKLKKVKDFYLENRPALQRIAVKTRHGIVIIPTHRIARIEAQDDYVFIHTLTGKRYLKDLTMRYLEGHLDRRDFIRVHRSHIIRIDQISRLEQESKSSWTVVLQNGHEVPVSRGNIAGLKAALGIRPQA